MNCNIGLKNTGRLCNEYIGYPIGIMFFESRKEFATEDAAKLLANWKIALKDLKSKRGYLLTDIYNYEPADDEAVTETGLAGKTIMLYQKGNADKFEIENPTDCEIKNWLSFNGRTLYAFTFFSQGYHRGLTDTEEVKYLAEKVYIQVSHKKSKGTESEKLVISIRSEEVNRKLEMMRTIKHDFYLSDLVGLIDVTVTAPMSTTAQVMSSVMSKCGSYGIAGLTKDDFVILNAAKVEQTISTATDNGDGTYLLTGTFTAGAHTINLVAPSELSTDAPLVESPKAATFTIAA